LYLVPISALPQDGNTALLLAVKNGRADVAKLLVDAGCDRNVENKVRGLRDHFYQLEMILYAGLSVLRTQKGETALSCANRKEVQDLLSDRYGKDSLVITHEHQQ
jgi:ankyrin repeat protein